MILLCCYILSSSGAVLRRTGGLISALLRLHTKIAKAAQGGHGMLEIKHTVI